MKYLLIFFLFCSLVWAQTKAQETKEQIYYPGRFDVSAYYLYQRQASIKKNSAFGVLDLFIPLVQNEISLFFLNVRTLDFYAKSIEGNFGLGLRHMLTDMDVIVGLNSFFDYKRSPHRNNFTQFTLGLEFKTRRWTINANGYVPFGKNQKKASDFDITKLADSGGAFQNILFKEGMEVALWGFDAEVGYELFPNFSFFAGGFHFDRKDAQHISGPFLRMQWWKDFKDDASNFFDELFFDVGYSYDHLRRSRLYAGLGLRWYFGGDKKRNYYKGLHKRMIEYVRRDFDVITSSNPNVPFKVLTKDDGSAVTVQVAKTLAQLNAGIAGVADVLAIDGAILVPSFVLANDVVLTGKNYIFGNNITIQLSNGGSLTGAANTITLSQNNTVRDLTLQNITLDSSSTVGHFLADNLFFNQTVSPYAIQILETGPSSDSVITIKNSHFKVNTTQAAQGIVSIQRSAPNFAASAQVHEIRNNTFDIKATNNDAYAIYLHIPTDNNDQPTLYAGLIADNKITLSAPSKTGAVGVYLNTASSLTAGAGPEAHLLNTTIRNNQITITSGSDHSGIRIENSAQDVATNAAQLIQINTIENNQVTIVNGIASFGILIQNSVSDTPAGELSITVNTLKSNSIAYTGGTNNVGIGARNVSTDANTTCSITIGQGGGFYQNTISNSESGAIGIWLDNATGPNTIDVKVNSNNQSLSGANGSAKVDLTGKVSGITVTP
jgi:hypothetical protein